jgi:hypothetical protein
VVHLEGNDIIVLEQKLRTHTVTRKSTKMSGRLPYLLLTVWCSLCILLRQVLLSCNVSSAIGRVRGYHRSAVAAAATSHCDKQKILQTLLRLTEFK